MFFGGSFAPPHIGHHQILHRLLCEPEVQCIHVVPTAHNPLKPENQDFNNFERKLLVEAWLEEISLQPMILAKRVHLELLELESSKPSFTVDSLGVLRSRFEGAKWVLAMGADLLTQLPRWKSINELLSSVDAVWVFKRGGYEFGPDLVPQELRPLCAWRFFPDHVETVSSTEIRAAEEGSDAMHPELRAKLLENVYQVVHRLLQQKKTSVQ